MESLILSIISKYLKDYVNNFRKEQISVNFLRGQGVIKDLDINVDVMNEMLIQTGAGGMRFTRILINTLSIEAPIMSLKSKPIVVYVDEMFIEVSEIVEIVKKPRPLSTAKKPAAPKYGFIDRVVDSISFEINKIYFALRTLGRLKTNNIGPWTPPVLLMELCGNKFYCTNHNGVQSELDECLRVRETKRSILFVYKTLRMKKMSAYLINPDIYFAVADELIAGAGSRGIYGYLNNKFGDAHLARGFAIYKLMEDVSLTINMCMRKRLDNNYLMGLELAFVFDAAIKICIKQPVFCEILHFLVGIYNAMLRRDVIEEAYGPNPHNEKLQTPSSSSKTSPLRSAISTTAMTPPPSAIADQASRRQKFTRDQFAKDEIASLDMMDAQFSSTLVTADDRDEWQRSSLNSDEDPPHFRLVIVMEFNMITFTLPFDNTILPPQSIYSRGPSAGASRRDVDIDEDLLAQSEHRNKHHERLKCNRGIIINVVGVVIGSVWPEHAAATEGVQQVTIKSANVTEYVGIQKTCLVRTKECLDAGGKPICVMVSPRGVKEQSVNDPENSPGTSIIMRKEGNWPPPPLSKGVGSRQEVCVCPLEITFKIEPFSSLISYIAGAWDTRWTTCDWGRSSPIGPMSDVHGGGSIDSFILFNGLEVTFFSDVADVGNTVSSKSTSNLNSPCALGRESDAANEKYSNVLLSAHVTVDIGLISLVWKHTLDLKYIRQLTQAEAANSSQNKSSTPLFPHTETDISLLLMRSKQIRDVDLVSRRFEASVSEISVRVASEMPLDLSTQPSKNPGFRRFGEEKPPSRCIINPFSILYFTSVDPNPDKLPILPPAKSFQDPYTRCYYWEHNSSTIATTYLSVDDVCVECSLLDLTRIMHTIDVISDAVKTCDAALWAGSLYPQTPAQSRASTMDVLDDNIMNSHANPHGDGMREDDIPATLVLVRLKNIQVFVSTDDKVNSMNILSDHNPGVARAAQEETILGISLKQFYVFAEWASEAPTLSSPELLLKGGIGGLSITAGNSPLFIVMNGDLENAMSGACSSGKMSSKWLSESTTLTFRYSAKIDQMTSLVSKLGGGGHFGSGIKVGSASSIMDNSSKNPTCSLTVQHDPNCKVIIALKHLDGSLHQIYTELLLGVGAINRKTTNWLDSTVLGYWRNLFMAAPADETTTKMVPIAKRQLLKVSPTQQIVDVAVLTSSMDIVLLDTQPTGMDYMGVNLSLSEACLHGHVLWGLPSMVCYHLSALQQFVLLSGNIGQPVTRSDLSSQFSICSDVFKSGFDPIQFKSNMSMQDIESTISCEHIATMKAISSNGLKIITKIDDLYKHVFKSLSANVPLFDDFLSTVQQPETINSAASSPSSAFAGTMYPDQMQSFMDLTLSLLSSSRVMPVSDTTAPITSEAAADEAASITTQEGYCRYHRRLVDEMSREFSHSYDHLKQVGDLLSSTTSKVVASLENVANLCKNVGVSLNKVQNAAVVVAGQLPSHCGWIMRTTSFSKSDKQHVSSSRCWGLLVQGTIYFMKQPYASTIDYEISLDGNVQVLDPDHNCLDSDAPSAHKVSLTPKLWIRHVEEHTTFVIDCCSLDEKVMWLSALAPWMASLDCHHQVTHHSHNKHRKSSGGGSGGTKQHRMSMTDFGAGAMASLTAAISADKKTAGAVASAAAGSVAIATSKASSAGARKLKAATRGLVRAFSMSSGRTAGSPTQAFLKSQSLNISSSSHGQGGTPDGSSSHGDEVGHSQLDQCSDNNTISNDADRDSLETIDHMYLTTSMVTPSPLPHGINPGPLTEVIQELEDIKAPLLQFSDVIDEVKNYSVGNMMDALNLIKKSQESVGSMLLGLSALDVMSLELYSRMTHSETKCKESVQFVTEKLHTEKAKCQLLREQWGKAKQLQGELESVLQACTMQHIGVVQSMSKQYDDLMDQFLCLRGVDYNFAAAPTISSAAGFNMSSTSVLSALSSSTSLNDMNRQLIMAVRELESLMDAAMETERMMNQEIVSTLAESSQTRLDNATLRHSIELAKSRQVDEVESMKQELLAAQSARGKAESERDAYKRRLEAVIQNLAVLGLDPLAYSSVDDS